MALAQPTFSDLEASSGRMTRRRRFPDLLDSRIPWDARAARVEPPTRGPAAAGRPRRCGRCCACTSPRSPSSSPTRAPRTRCGTRLCFVKSS